MLPQRMMMAAGNPANRASTPSPFTTEWKSAGAGASAGGGNAWSNPGNIIDSDDTYAESSTGFGVISAILRATDFGFTEDDVPSGATIIGIEVGIERRQENAVDNVTDTLVQLRTSSGTTGDNKASDQAWPSSDAEAVYGGADDDWSAGLSDSDIRSSGFGVDLQPQDGTQSQVFVDHIRIRVHGEV